MLSCKIYVFEGSKRTFNAQYFLTFLGQLLLLTSLKGANAKILLEGNPLSRYILGKKVKLLYVAYGKQMTMAQSVNGKLNNKPSIIHLTTSVEGDTYVLGTLSFNSIKEEFSYHFTYPQDAPDIQLNCETCKYTSPLDHITWHKNIAHIKRRDNIAIERVTLTNGPLFCKQPVITPFYVESIYFQADGPCLRKIGSFRLWTGSQCQEILNLNSSDGFSVIFMLVPANLDTPSILVGTQFMVTPENLDFPPCLLDLCDFNHKPGRIQLWNGWDFLVLTSPGKCRILSPIPPIFGDSFRLPNYQNVPAAITDLLMQANN